MTRRRVALALALAAAGCTSEIATIADVGDPGTAPTGPIVDAPRADASSRVEPAPAVDAGGPTPDASAPVDSGSPDTQAPDGALDDGAAPLDASDAADAPATPPDAAPPTCPGFTRWEIPADTCLYINQGSWLELDDAGAPICGVPHVDNGDTCLTATANLLPRVLYVSDSTSSQYRSLFAGSCPQPGCYAIF